MSVYFLRAGKTGPIKIGYTKGFAPALPQMQRGNHEPLVILSVIDGDMSKEKEFHRRFAAWRLRGEWFRAENPLIEMINSLPPYQHPNHSPEKQRAKLRCRAVAKPALEEAIRRAGSRYALAKAIRITTQAIYHWGDEAPIERVLAIEAATGVSRHELRPGIYPPEKITAVSGAA